MHSKSDNIEIMMKDKADEVIDIKKRYQNKLEDDTYKDIVEDVEIRFDTSNYELDRSLLKGNNKKVIGLMKDELHGKILVKLVGLRAKSYSYLINDVSEDKKQKAQKSVS